MFLHTEARIPDRYLFGSAKRIHEETILWPRIHRQVFWLADGKRDIYRIALLLYKPVYQIEQIVSLLAKRGYVFLRREPKVITMNIVLLKESFQKIVPHKERFAHDFYEHLFETFPETKPYFKDTNMARQESSLMATLATVISAVERGDNLTPVLEMLGEKHAKRHIPPEYFEYVGASLLHTFQRYVGNDLNIIEAWQEAYTIISQRMLETFSKES